MGPQPTYLKSVEKIDIEGDTITSVEIVPMHETRADAVAALFMDDIYVMGGETQ